MAFRLVYCSGRGVDGLSEELGFGVYGFEQVGHGLITAWRGYVGLSIYSLWKGSSLLYASTS